MSELGKLVAEHAREQLDEPIYCRAGCPTLDHRSWGECARAARIQVDRESLKR